MKFPTACQVYARFGAHVGWVRSYTDPGQIEPVRIQAGANGGVNVARSLGVDATSLSQQGKPGVIKLKEMPAQVLRQLRTAPPMPWIIQLV